MFFIYSDTPLKFSYRQTEDRRKTHRHTFRFYCYDIYYLDTVGFSVDNDLEDTLRSDPSLELKSLHHGKVEDIDNLNLNLDQVPANQFPNIPG